MGQEDGTKEKIHHKVMKGITDQENTLNLIHNKRKKSLNIEEKDKKVILKINHLLKNQIDLMIDHCLQILLSRKEIEKKTKVENIKVQNIIKSQNLIKKVIEIKISTITKNIQKKEIIVTPHHLRKNRH
jgi:hypothetical protein